MSKNKKIIIASGIIFLVLAVIVAIVVSLGKRNDSNAITTSTEIITESTIEPQTLENVQATKETDDEIITSTNNTSQAFVDISSTKPTNTATETTKKPESTTKKPVEQSTQQVTTTKPIETTTKPVTTQPAQRSLLQATDIPGKYTATSFEKAFFDRINLERTSRGLPALIWNDNLHAFSGVRAKEIITKWGHERPNGKMPASLLDENNISRSAFGENLVRGTPMEEKYIDALVEALMNSPGHKANILSTSYKYSSISAFTDSNGLVYVVQLFYTP